MMFLPSLSSSSGRGFMVFLGSIWALTTMTTVQALHQTLNFIPKSQLPVTGQEWVSLDESMEFLPAQAEFLNFGLQRRLGSSSSSNNKNSPYSTEPFVEGESDYDAYQQAWRYLGFMIDCNANSDDDGGGDGHHSGSGDTLTGEGCSRYVVWAAYVDLDYQGGGIGEYQYWDRWNSAWDTTPCLYADAGGSGDRNKNNNNNDDDASSGSRCAKMDCHLEDTHFSLLGFFKHKSYDDWMEQLFKHEGMCIWTYDEYAFMKNARKRWPQGCAISGTTTSNGNPIYYDLKPLSGGDITLGLYTDTKCVVEYVSSGSNDPINIENVLGNILLNGGSHDEDNDSSDYTLTQALAMWDSAFDIFKICQPCVAHDLYNVAYASDDDSVRGMNYGMYYLDDDYVNAYSGNGDNFDCYDDAGYTNVNQCMKFMAKTVMKTATFKDLALATSEGTLVNDPLVPYRGSSSTTSYFSKQVASYNNAAAASTALFFLLSSAFCVGGLFLYRRARKNSRSPKLSIQQPLVFA